MYSQTDRSPEEQIEAFNQRLERLAAAQGEALLWLGAARAQWDIERLYQPPSLPLGVRARRWIGRQVTTLCRRFAPMNGWPDEEKVVIVEVDYRVLDPTEADSMFRQREEPCRWDK